MVIALDLLLLYQSYNFLIQIHLHKDKRSNTFLQIFQLKAKIHLIYLKNSISFRSRLSFNQASYHSWSRLINFKRSPGVFLFKFTFCFMFMPPDNKVKKGRNLFFFEWFIKSAFSFTFVTILVKNQNIKTLISIIFWPFKF